MTLGRIFDPRDEGLLLAVAHGPDGNPVAFCQFVPAPGIRGYSLDLMRRDQGEHPNGLLDFIIVRTIDRLRSCGDEHLGLNFATMRAVIAGEDGGGMQRWLLRRMSDSMQIESLWRFNAKFGPTWLPRYVVWDAAENTLPMALAIARAESFWELPLDREVLPTSGQRQQPRGRRCELALRLGRSCVLSPRSSIRWPTGSKNRSVPTMEPSLLTIKDIGPSPR